MVHLVPQNKSDFFSVNSENSELYVCYFAVMNVAASFSLLMEQLG